jgi:hypothetical protein
MRASFYNDCLNLFIHVHTNFNPGKWNYKTKKGRKTLAVFWPLHLPMKKTLWEGTLNQFKRCALF